MNIKALMPIAAIAILAVAWFAIFGGGLSSPEDVSIAVTGDVMLGGDVSNILSLGTSPFQNVSNVTSNADLLLINFECAATSSYEAFKTDIPLKCNPGHAVLARGNNNTVAALANNHVCDYGPQGLQDTLNALDQYNITHIGAGRTADEAFNGVTQEINGRKITVLNYMDSNNFAEYSYRELPYANGTNPGYAAYDSKEAKTQIQNAKADGDFVLVFMHFGNEYTTSPNDAQKNISHELIDNGADIVLGAHPHVAQGIEMYRGKPIFYSLGDFVFDLDKPGTQEAYFVEIKLIEDKGVCSVYPVKIDGYLPYYMDSNSATAFLKGLTPNDSHMQIEDGVGKLEFNLTDGD